MTVRNRHRLRPAFSLLELLVTCALMATIVTSATVVLRTAQTAWTGHSADHAKLDAAYATLRHITRGVRQADIVTAISSAADNSGSLGVVSPTGQALVWDHSGTNVNYGVNAPTSLLASDVSELTFIGYKADGVTTTTTPADVQSVLCTVKVNLDRTHEPQRVIGTRVWLRAW